LSFAHPWVVAGCGADAESVNMLEPMVIAQDPKGR